MKENKSITLPEIAIMLNLSLGAIEKAVRQMKKEGDVRHVGPNKGGRLHGELKKHWISYREKAIREKIALEIPENSLPLSVVQGSPSGLRPSVNP